jgi:hypothetical protein
METFDMIDIWALFSIISSPEFYNVATCGRWKWNELLLWGIAKTTNVWKWCGKNVFELKKDELGEIYRAEIERSASLLLKVLMGQ